MRITASPFLLIAAALATGPGCSGSDEPTAPAPPATGGIKLARGLGSFMYDGYTPLAEKPIRVWYYSPRAVSSNLPIVFVFHGNTRNADDYRDAWVSHADEHLLLVIAPEFDEGFFPGSAGYAQGNVFDDSNNAVDEELWTFSYVEPLFDHVKDLVASSAEDYLVFGHSAGSQFVHPVPAIQAGQPGSSRCSGKCRMVYDAGSDAVVSVRAAQFGTGGRRP